MRTAYHLGANMRISSYLFFLKKRFVSLKKIHIMSTAVSVICFVLLGFSIVFPWLYHKAYRDVDRLLPTGLDSAVVIDHTTSGDISTENAFILDMKASETINSVGSSGTYLVFPEFYYENNSIKDRVLEISKNGLDNFRTNQNAGMQEPGIECIAVSGATLDFYNINLYKGSFDSVSSDNTVIFLGYNYRDIPLGTVLRNTDYLGNVKDQVVVGILEKNTEIIDVHACANSYAMNVNYSINLDNMILAVQEYSDDFHINMSGPLVVSLAEEISYEEGVSEIRRIGDKYGKIINPAPLEGKMHVMLSEFDILLDLTSSITPVLVGITIIILISSHLLILIYRNRELAVWLSNGLTNKQVHKIVLFETILKMVSSAIISGILLSIFMKKQLQLVESVEHRMLFDVYLFTPLCLVASAFIISFVIYGVVKIYLSGRSITQLINLSKTKNIFNVLIVVSFAATFIAVYYGLNFYNLYSSAKNNQSFYRYREIYQYAGKGGNSDLSSTELRLNDLDKGIMLKGYELPVGNETNRPVRIDYLLKQNEKLLETVNEGDINDIIEKADAPSCVIGDYWLKWTYEEKGYKYIDILGEKICVIASFKSVSLPGYDKRFYIIGNTIDYSVLDKWNKYSSDIGYLYKSSERNDYGNVLFDTFEEFYGEDRVRDLQGPAADESWNSAVKLLRNYTPIIIFVLGTTIILCVINISFLVFVWSRSNIYEYMVKRTFGYKTKQLLPEILKRICSLEIIGCVAMLMVTLIFEAFIHEIGTWSSNIINGSIFLIIIFMIVGIVISLVPLKWISKQEPVTVISCRE